LLAVTAGVFDELEIERIRTAEKAVCTAVRKELPALRDRLESGETLTEKELHSLVRVAKQAIRNYTGLSV